MICRFKGYIIHAQPKINVEAVTFHSFQARVYDWADRKDARCDEKRSRIGQSRQQVADSKNQLPED